MAILEVLTVCWDLGLGQKTEWQGKRLTPHAATARARNEFPFVPSTVVVTLALSTLEGKDNTSPLQTQFKT